MAGKDWSTKIMYMAEHGPVVLGRTEIVMPNDSQGEHFALYLSGRPWGNCEINFRHGVTLEPEKAARLFAELTELVRRHTGGEVQEVQPVPEGLRVDQCELG
jgi:hypothetical protein